MKKTEKRVLVNIPDYDGTPHWLFVPKSLVDPSRPVKPLPVKRPKLRPKAFANPYSWGYGGGETPWPFDRQKAMRDGRYRAGIRNAIGADWTASNWKHAARSALLDLLEELIAED